VGDLRNSLVVTWSHPYSSRMVETMILKLVITKDWNSEHLGSRISILDSTYRFVSMEETEVEF